MTVIAPMDSLTLVCNAVFAPVILKEQVRNWGEIEEKYRRHSVCAF